MTKKISRMTIFLLFFVLIFSGLPAADFVKDKVAQKTLDHAVTIVVYYYMDEAQYNQVLMRLSAGHKPFLVNPIGRDEYGRYVMAYIGSGGVIPRNHVLTASHLFDDYIYYSDMEIWVYRRTSRAKITKYSAEILYKTSLATNDWNDYAVLKVDVDMKLPGLKLAKKAPKINDKIIWCGSLAGFMAVLRTDYLALMKNYLIRQDDGSVKVCSWKEYDLYCFSPGAPGDSGTPVLNKRGEIVSVLCWGIAASEYHVYLLGNPLSQLKEFLGSNHLEGLFK